ncbi:hypothetical protein K2173_005694 [Erythroxylum novogranatense]|uniref:MADS-box domain-containing protein n=1 Tax=Erythroxylum novogranatense TaxID=1862640 RepID=A0AAV8SRD3_9ROSI|nr:hypothetical protein K2173_005694 [Erythroxylum novogranatense]
MVKRRIQISRIVNDRARNSSFTKRRGSLVKMVSELSTLCDVRALLIIFSPRDNEPKLWPSNDDVRQLLNEYQSIPEVERSKKMENQESYLRGRVQKMCEKSLKLQETNYATEIDYLMHQIHVNGIEGLELVDQITASKLVEQKLQEIRARIVRLRHQEVSDMLMGQHVAAENPNPLEIAATGGSGMEFCRTYEVGGRSYGSGLDRGLRYYVVPNITGLGGTPHGFAGGSSSNIGLVGPSLFGGDIPVVSAAAGNSNIIGIGGVPYHGGGNVSNISSAGPDGGDAINLAGTATQLPPSSQIGKDSSGGSGSRQQGPPALDLFGSGSDAGRQLDATQTLNRSNVS